MKLHRSAAAFTFVEAMISLGLSGLLAGIIYVVATESLSSFARNISINRSYTEAHQALDRIAQTIGTAAHTPILIDTDGAPTTNTPAAGIRFYRGAPSTNYKIMSGSTGPSSANKTITIQLGAGQLLPAKNDVAVIPTLGYQGTVAATPVASGSNYVVTFTNTLANDSTPTPTAAVDLTTPTPYYLQTYTQVAFIVVTTTSGNELRYYPRAKTVAGDTAAVFNNTSNYQVLASLVPSAFGSDGKAAKPLLPFSITNSPTVQVQLYAANPEYSNRTTAGLGFVNQSNTYTFMQCSLGARSPVMMTHGPY